MKILSHQKRSLNIHFFALIQTETLFFKCPYTRILKTSPQRYSTGCIPSFNIEETIYLRFSVAILLVRKKLISLDCYWECRIFVKTPASFCSFTLFIDLIFFFVSHEHTNIWKQPDRNYFRNPNRNRLISWDSNRLVTIRFSKKSNLLFS